MHVRLQVSQDLRVPLHIVRVILHHRVLQIRVFCEFARNRCRRLVAYTLTFPRHQILTRLLVSQIAAIFLHHSVPLRELSIFVLAILVFGLERVSGDKLFRSCFVGTQFVVWLIAVITIRLVVSKLSIVSLIVVGWVLSWVVFWYALFAIPARTGIGLGLVGWNIIIVEGISVGSEWVSCFVAWGLTHIFHFLQQLLHFIICAWSSELAGALAVGIVVVVVFFLVVVQVVIFSLVGSIAGGVVVVAVLPLVLAVAAGVVAQVVVEVAGAGVDGGRFLGFGESFFLQYFALLYLDFTNRRVSWRLQLCF